MGYFAQEVIKAAQDHAIADYPAEACGVVVAGVYHPMRNTALPSEQHTDSPECDCVNCSFSIDPSELVTALAGRDLEGVIHSHPDGPFHPSKSDMLGQIAHDVPWGIITTDGVETSDIATWGGQTPIEPLVGRTFMHGITDCYSIIRDTFRLGKHELAKQGIDWPFEPIDLAEIPRDDNWWLNGEDLYIDNFAKMGFRVIDMSQTQPGDVFFCKIRSNTFNHGGVMLEGNLMLHHLQGKARVSRREPVGGWAKVIDMWIRYEGVADAA